MRKLRLASIVLAALVLAGFGVVYAGIFNAAADNPHWGVTQRLLESAREHSIAARAGTIEAPPALDDPKLIEIGAEHYAEMCTGCHLAPGVRESEIRTGLNPKPPNLVEHGQNRSPEQIFWIIKHGLRMTGMPAWGLTHDDESIWGLVAFLRKLPELSPDEYQEMVEQSGGHSHGEAGHGHDEAADEHMKDEERHDHTTHSHDSAPGNTATNGAPLPPSTVEPVALVERFFRALASGDTTSASAALDPAVLIFESGGVERSRQEYASHHLGADAAFLKSAKHQLISRTGDALGDLAWVASETRLTSQGSNPADLVSTETMVLRKTSNGWRIVHIHWSSRKAGA